VDKPGFGKPAFDVGRQSSAAMQPRRRIVSICRLGATVIGYMAWLHALARGGVSVLQFLQPIFTFIFAGVLLGGRVTAAELVVMSATILMGGYYHPSKPRLSVLRFDRALSASQARFWAPSSGFALLP
jgi:hypothetical protein